MNWWPCRAPPWAQRLETKLDDLAIQVTKLLVFARAEHKQLEEMRMTLAELKQKVADESTVVDSVVVLLTGLSQQLKDAIANGANPAEVQAIADQIDAQRQKLADAVVANTPSE